MKVNMTPNPLDVVTIHASQGDSEARQWEFELHNNGELIDTSEVTDQIVFKAYKGGTEQILPENTSTPTTSPFKGDIKYPQGLLSDQEFTYRQSPTEEDGLAKITDIKGNTLVWNQLANVGTLSATASYSGYLNIGTFSFVANHKYLIKYHQDNAMASNTRNTLQVRFATVGQTVTENATANAHLSQGDYSWLFNSTNTDTNTIVRFWVVDNNVAVSYSNIMIFDLTQMGLDITDPSDFTSLFSLPYYAYNQGTLLSFMGNGIKTVGKNLINIAEFVQRSGYSNLSVSQINNIITISGYSAGGRFACFNVPLIIGKQYTIKLSARSNVTGVSFIQSSEKPTSWIGNGTSIGINAPVIFTANSSWLQVVIEVSADNATVTDLQLELGASATDYEPYTSSTLSLPISTYFPSGMKSAGNVYDELTESKAITRVGSVDLGTLNWEILGTVGVSHLFLARTGVNSANDNIQQCDRNIKISSSKYTPVASWNSISMDKSNMAYGVYETQVRISDSNYTTVETFKASLSGVYLNYELATYEETSFSTASLATENAEIPLSNEDGTLIGKCTEQLSENPGFFDAKIKLADADGECYSNKIQLHVERKPS